MRSSPGHVRMFSLRGGGLPGPRTLLHGQTPTATGHRPFRDCLYIYEPESGFCFCSSQEESCAWTAGCHVPRCPASPLLPHAGHRAHGLGPRRGSAGSLSRSSRGRGHRPVSRRAGQSHQISDPALWVPFSPGGRPRPRGGWGRVCLSMALFLPDHWAGGLSPSSCDPAAQPGCSGPHPCRAQLAEEEVPLPLPSRPPLSPQLPPQTCWSRTGPHPPPPALPDLHRGSLGLHRFRVAGGQRRSPGAPQLPHLQSRGSHPARRRCPGQCWLWLVHPAQAPRPPLGTLCFPLVTLVWAVAGSQSPRPVSAVAPVSPGPRAHAGHRLPTLLRSACVAACGSAWPCLFPPRQWCRPCPPQGH